jgi:hypothetical protein
MTASIVISQPIAGSSQTVTFVASGTANYTAGTNDVIGYIIAGGTQYNGTVIQHGTPWAISFSQPTGTFSGAVLRIEQVLDGTNSFAQETINLNPASGGGHHM